MAQPQTITDLGRLVKSRHPEYADMPDDVVGRAVKSKFPGSYDDFQDSPNPAPAAVDPTDPHGPAWNHPVMETLKNIALSPIRGLMGIPDAVRQWATPNKPLSQLGDPFEDISPAAYMGDMAMTGGAMAHEVAPAVGAFSKEALPGLLPKAVKAFLPDLSGIQKGMQAVQDLRNPKGMYPDSPSNYDFLPAMPQGYGPTPGPPPPDFLPGMPQGYGSAPYPAAPDFLPARPPGYGMPSPYPPPPDFLPGMPEGYGKPINITTDPKTVAPIEPMKPMDAVEAHRYAHAQATEAELPGSPAGSSRGAHDYLSGQAKIKYGVKSWHELSPAQMQSMGDELLQTNRAGAASIPPVK